jgi:hypothetical protein|tara:strand:- start:363 stop:581 length:219 start_codon:yes stop_codon:yes gene_type:complete
MQGHECEAANALIEIKWAIWDEIVKARKLRDEANLENNPRQAEEYHLVAGGLTHALNIVRDHITDPDLARLA